MASSEFYRRLAELLEAKKREYCVYALVNHTKRAIYFGVSKNPIVRYLQHLLNQVDATKYWSFDKDDIDRLTIAEDLTQAEASDQAHALEKMTFEGLEEYRVIQTKGI
jgi:predicted GIY-YIG superfamily endonuclease